ncbi:MAG: hypothetical protein IJ769_01670 [Clostridia bacterium]|nr:hypothetical protein [Clostridia bacterium]
MRRAAVTILALAAALLLTGASARAVSAQSWLLEKSGVESLAALSKELGGLDVDRAVSRLMSGELRVDQIEIQRLLERFAASLREGLTDALAALAAPVLASLALRALMGDSSGGVIALLCRASCAALLTERFLQARHIAEAALAALVRMVGAASPVLIAALTLTGSAQRATILTPTTALCASLIEAAFQNVGLPLCGVAAVIAAASSLSDRFQLNRLFELLRRSVTWGISLLMAGFVGVMAVEGLLVSGQDALSARAVRRAIQAALPIIGGDVGYK